MITREEAIQTIHDCRITSLGELAHGYTVYQATANTLINQIFDQFGSQLSSNNLQLTCDGCKSNHNTQSFYCSTCERLPRRDYYEPKDTK